MPAFRMLPLAGLIAVAVAGALAFHVPASVAAQKQSISGRYNCACMSGDNVVSGTCSIIVSESDSATCGKATGDTCNATCKLITFTKGATGGAAAIKGNTDAVKNVAPTVRK